MGQLLGALEIQLKALISSHLQKDNEIEQLKQGSHYRLLHQKKKLWISIKPRLMSSTNLGGVKIEYQFTGF